MKIRKNLVSNSSSSSFIVSINDLHGEQLSKIYEHKELNDLNDYDRWWIYSEDGYLHGRCNMDNFSMREYMEEIGVDLSKVRFEYD